MFSSKVRCDPSTITELYPACTQSSISARSRQWSRWTPIVAVAVGNVHGLTSTPISLDLDRLAAIRDAVPVPLVLHGASGLPDEQLSGAIRCGVAKININTELRQAYLAAVVSVLPSVLASHDSVALWRSGREAVRTAAVRSINTLAGSQQAVPSPS